MTAPLISILMPIRNEAAYIGRSLAAVLAQDYPVHEILVADGMSTDGTREVVAAAAAREARLRLIDNPARIVAAGLNAALRQAQGEILIRVDGHCEIAPDYVRRCVEHLQRDGVEAVGGSVVTVGETFTAQVIAAAMSSPFGAGDSAFRVSQGVTRLADTIPFPAYSRALVERAGPYDEELVRNQDDEYNYRLRGMGVRLLLAADVRSRYFSRASLGRLGRQYFEYGYWKVRVLQKHPRQMSARQFAPPALALALTGGAAVAIAWPPARVAWLAMVAAYTLASLLASAEIAARRGWKYLGLLPASFACLHLGFGFGFLTGCFAFWNRWGDTSSRLRPGQAG
jgi:glycosyltransferase involved in cell wall biosynthesis